MSNPQRYFIAALALSTLLFAGMAHAEQNSNDGLWKEIGAHSLSSQPAMAAAPATYRTLSLNKDALSALLTNAPMEFTNQAKEAAVVITLPKPDGTFVRFRIEESPMLSPEIAAQHPDWKTYSGRGVDDPTIVTRFSWSNDGLRAAVLEPGNAYYIDPYSPDDAANYIAYFKRDLPSERGGFHCDVDRYLANADRSPAHPAVIATPAAPQFSTGATLKTYRLAIATTGEYTVNRGGQASAFNDVMNAVNRINLIFRGDLSVSFTLVSGTNTVFPNPATDPYNNTDGDSQLNINQARLDTIIGSANYDMGHLFGTGGGGVAVSPSVCTNGQKAKAYSARQPPTGDAFWVDYVAHEFAHQLSADHTYNTSENGNCSTRSAENAFEVASGATIMSYAGICSERNLQQFCLDTFHVRSLIQMIAEVSSPFGGGACGSTTATSNSVPTLNPGPTFNIPKQTPFTLTATASDADGDALTYSWEEYDLAAAASGPQGVPPGTYDVDSDGALRPLFRVYPPTASPSRTYPSLPYILNNANVPPLTFTGTSPTGVACPDEVCVTGENLPTQTRTMNFRVVVRDGKGGTADAGAQVNVRAESGPFVVTSPNAAINATGGSLMTVTWNVNNTTAAPVSAANVKISLSNDGGNSFPMTLLASTANDGSETVTLPNISTTTARIKVEAVGNIFFDISDASFSITGSGAPGLVGNVSTRLPVGTDDNVLIEGFIVQGPAGSTKKIMVRALGPSLAPFGITDALPNPTLEIRDAGNALIASNNDWKNTEVGGIITGDQSAEITASGLAPANDAESAIIADLPVGSYTAIVRGVSNTTGTGVVDAYDLSAASPARLANISTRGLIQPGDKLMIAGFIIQNGPVRAVVRAIGPSLAAFGVTNALNDTTLQLRDVNGTIVIENDDWQTNVQQKQELEASGLQPSDTREAAVIANIQPGQYTAQVRGKPESTGIGVVQVYFLQQ